MTTLAKVVDNVLHRPDDARTRQIRCGNAAFMQKVRMGFAPVGVARTWELQSGGCATWGRGVAAFPGGGGFVGRCKYAEANAEGVGVSCFCAVVFQQDTGVAM